MEMQLRGGGRLSVMDDGRVVQMKATRPNDGRGLYKVWIRGVSGRLLLGTLAPEDGALCLRRRLSRSELERSGCWPIAGGESVLAFSFDQPQWNREARPERLVKDVVLHRALEGRSVLMRRQKDGFCLAAPFDRTRPFPLTALFCLAEIRRVEGRVHAVFNFDREGVPTAPHNAGRSGENSGTS